MNKYIFPPQKYSIEDNILCIYISVQIKFCSHPYLRSGWEYEAPLHPPPHLRLYPFLNRFPTLVTSSTITQHGATVPFPTHPKFMYK